jgi:adenylylsulfate kinase
VNSHNNLHHSREARSAALDLIGQRGAVVWLTGLSGSGKTTLARALAARLEEAGKLGYVVDGDQLRQGLSAGLGFSPEDRAENIRRAGAVAAILADAGTIAIVALISPYREDRDRVRRSIGPERFFEVHLSTPIEECERRDAKGLYARARAGDLVEFTGVSAPYEEPLTPELAFDTSRVALDEATDRIMRLLEDRGHI